MSGYDWGATVNDKGCIGIWWDKVEYDTNVVCTVYVYFWSKWSVSDSSNHFYFNWDTNAYTDMGAKTIRHTVSSGGGWSTANQTLLGVYSITVNKENAPKQIWSSASFSGIEAVGGTMYYSSSWNIPALNHTVSYNANGGSGAPGNQTKVYGSILKLSSVKPTKTGYTFKGWGTYASDTSPNYQPGGAYGTDEDLTLYAIWEQITYTVSYNANGGSGAPGNQTKVYTERLALSTTKPTRSNYDFKGWSTSSQSTSATYQPGDYYTKNANLTLYAVWALAYIKPIIKSVSIERCLEDGTLADDGTYVHVKFDWTTYLDVTSIVIEYKEKSDSSTTWTSETISASGKSGTVDTIIGGTIDSELSYDVKITVSDSSGNFNMTDIIRPMDFIIDFSPQGGIGFGIPAEESQRADFAYPLYAKDNIFDKFSTRIANGYAMYTGSGENAIDPNTTNEELILTNHTNCPVSGTYFYIRTMFHSSKSATTNRAQIATSYSTVSYTYYRVYHNGSWKDWEKYVNNNELSAYAKTSALSDYAKINGWPTFQAIELKYSTPFIDFHHNNSSADWTTRIITSGTGILDILQNATYGGIRFNGSGGQLIPLQSGGYSLGGSGNRFYKLWVSSGVDNSSLLELKTQIKPFISALDEIDKTDVFNYKLKDTIERHGDDIFHTGFVIGEGYNCSEYLISESKEGIDLYSAIGVTFGGLKELYQLVKEQQSIINDLKDEILELKSEVNDLKSKNESTI